MQLIRRFFLAGVSTLAPKHKRAMDLVGPRGPFSARAVALLMLMLSAVAFSQQVSAQESAESATIYFNGSILTMEGDSPEYAEAIVVQKGKIAFVGTLEAAAAVAGGTATRINLQGRTMLPGFIDGWGHFTLLAQQTLGVDLSYFGTNPRSKAELVARLKGMEPFNGWVVGHGYAAGFLSDGTPSLQDLDAAFPNTPVIIADLSTLTGKVNSSGIRKLRLTLETPAVQPGEIVKDPKTGQLTGDLIFMPFKAAMAEAIGSYPQDVVFQTFRDAEAKLVREGYTTVQTYQLTPQELPNLRAAFDQDVLSVDVVAFPSADATGEQLILNPDWVWGAYSHVDRGLKIAGMMLPVDSGPQLRLASFVKPYLDTSGLPDGWQGITTPIEAIERWATYAYANDIQLFGYAAGDAGIDAFLDAISKAIAATGKTGDVRTVVSHSTFVRDDQLERYKDKHIIAAMWPINSWLYGDTYLKTLGPERANATSPFARAAAKGVLVSAHADYPGADPSVIAGVWSGATRRTISGQALGEPELKASAYLLLLGFTRHAAFMYREESTKGTITAGKFADLVILDRNPLAVAPDDIKNIVVVETIKRGKTIYRWK